MVASAARAVAPLLLLLNSAAALRVGLGDSSTEKSAAAANAEATAAATDDYLGSLDALVADMPASKKVAELEKALQSILSAGVSTGPAVEAIKKELAAARRQAKSANLLSSQEEADEEDVDDIEVEQDEDEDEDEYGGEEDTDDEVEDSEEDESEDESDGDAKKIVGDKNPLKNTVAVCITGQLSRLELESKMVNVFQALEEKVGNVHVFLVLEKDSNFYVNQDTKAAPGCETAPSAEKVKEELGKFYIDGAFPNHRDHKPNMTRWPMYGSTKMRVERSMRLAAHFSQWEHLSTCVDLIEKHEETVDGTYESVIKMRDNTVAQRNLAQHVAFPLTTTLVKGCASWRGVNDKVLLAPRKHFSDAMRGPMQLANQVETGLEDAMKKVAIVENPEQMMLRVWCDKGVPFSRVSPEILPLVDGRCTKVTKEGISLFHTQVAVRKQWAPVSEAKDCNPKSFARVKQNTQSSCAKWQAHEFNVDKVKDMLKIKKALDSVVTTAQMRKRLHYLKNSDSEEEALSDEEDEQGIYWAGPELPEDDAEW